MRLASTSLALSVSLLACSGAPTTYSVRPSDSTQPAIAAPAASNLPDARAPKSLVALVRVNDVARSIASVDQIVKFPKPLGQTIDALINDKGARFVSLSGSFDVAVVLDSASTDDEPKFLWAFSAAVKSVEEAAEFSRKDGAEVRTLSSGSYRARSKDGTVCDIGPSAGDSTARVVCSDHEEALREMSGWLARGLPLAQKKPADVFIELDAAPLKDRYLPFLRGQADENIPQLKKLAQELVPGIDTELLELPNVIVKESLAFAEDTDSIQMSFTLDPRKPELRASTTMSFRSKTSFVTDLVSRMNERPEGPPEAFLRLPKDAASATWSRALDPALFRGVRRVIHKGALAGLSLSPKLPDADKKGFVDWLDAFPSFSGVWVSASGGVELRPAIKGKLTPTQAIEEAKQTARRWIPWSIAGGEGDSAQMITWLKTTENAYTRGVAAFKREVPKLGAKDLAFLPTMKFSASVAGYPKGSAALDVDFKFSSKDIWDLLPQNKYAEQANGKFEKPQHPKGADAKGTLTLRIVVVPEDANHYWFGYSVDPEALKSRMLSVQKGASAAGTLGARVDLDTLKSHKGFGGFVSYAGLVDTLRSSDPGSSDSKKIDEALEVMPHKGRSPIFFLGGGNTGATPSITLDLVAPKDWVEDIAALSQHFAPPELGGKAAPSPPTPTPVTPSVPPQSGPPTRTAPPPRPAPPPTGPQPLKH